MSVAYAMTDHGPSADGQVSAGAVSVGGGCGSMHAVQVDAGGHPFIECGTCGPHLAAGHYGWAASPAGVPLTPDELAERELAERDGVAMQRIVLKSVTDSLVGQAAAAKQGRQGLMEQLKAMSESDRAELLAFLQDGQPEPEARRPARSGGKS